MGNRDFVRHLFLALFLGFGLLTAACSKKAPEDIQEVEYDGPLVVAEDVKILFSDSAIVRVRLTAIKQFEYESGDRQFPEGIHLEFLDIDGGITSTLDADSGFYFHETNLYRAASNVVVKNYNKDEQLNTEELYWDPTKETVYTDKYVKIEHEGGTNEGTGMTAKQDFSEWEILNPIGTLDEEEDF